MAQQARATIKTYFETGDVPTQSQFGNSFDSQVFWVDDVETDLTSNSDLKVPTVKAVVDGIATKQDILTAGNMHTYVDSLTALTTPADADRMIIVDNSASLAKRITWANIKATLKTYFDTLYATSAQVSARRKTLQSTGLGTGVTGTTANTFCKAMLVPANTFLVGDVPMLTTRIIKTNTVGTITARVYVNTTPDIAGSPILLATTPAQVSGTRTFATMRNIAIESATESIVTSATTANSIEEAVTAAAETTMNIDWTIAQYIVVSIQLGSGSDTGNCRYILIN
jgi:hypothetical protein